MFDVEQYIQDVQNQISKFKKYTELFDDYSKEIHPETLYEAMAHFSQVNFTLNSEYQRARAELKNLESDFQEFYDPIYLEAREEVYRGKPASFKASDREVECFARTKHKQEYREWNDRLQQKKIFVEFMEKLLKQWSEHQYMLGMIANAMRTDLKALSWGEAQTQDEVPQTRRRIMG